LLKLKVTEINSDGIVLEMFIERFTMKPKEGQQELAKVLDKLTGAFTVTLSHEHTILRIEGLKDLLDKLIDVSDAQAKREFKDYSFESTVRTMFQETFNLGPSVGTAMNVGAWQHKSGFDWGSVGSFQITRAYKYEGKEKQGEKIAITEDYKYRLPKGEAAEDKDLKITKGDVNVEESKGVLIFDPKARRLVRTEFNTRVVGQLQGSVQNEATNIEVRIETGTTIRVFDKMPEDPAASKAAPGQKGT
jgi:hypothetical protein